MAGVPEHTRGETIGRRAIQLAGLLWLGMLIAPVEELLRRPDAGADDPEALALKGRMRAFTSRFAVLTME